MKRILAPYTKFCTDKRGEAGKYMSLAVAGLAVFFVLFTFFPALFRAKLLIIPVLFAFTLILLYSGFVSGMDETDKGRKKCRIWLRNL